MNKSISDLQQEIKTKLAYAKGMIKRRAQGALKYDYLVPNGVYEEQWDWDAFFMGVALTSEIPSEAIYLKNWSLNYILNSHPDGKVGGCITKDGEDPRLNHMKPFLAQGAYIGGKNLNDFSWLKPHWSAFKKVVLYREKMYWDKETDLGMWFNSMESGADNDAGLYRCESLKNKEKKLGKNYDQMRKDGGGHVFEKVEDYPHASVVAVDANTYIYREYTALSKVAYKLNKEKDAIDFAEKAKNIKKNMRKYLWNEEDGMYYNLDTTTKKHIKKVSYSCFLSLFGGIP
ncbi:MAG: trehalase family glycosidase, partial [Candidatus Roizmanbacteria bacterium]|nr:trehalase family glycosidase [Candidatus Roizmanbacteria bacterium]